MELAPNLHRIGNDIVAVYLISDTDGVTVIDAGLPGHYRDLVRELALMGKTLADVRGLILTHGDSDHIGFAERLRREYRVPVYVHSADAERAKGNAKGAMGKQQMNPAGLLSFVAYTLRKNGLRNNYLTEVVEARPGETLDLPGAPQIGRASCRERVCESV